MVGCGERVGDVEVGEVGQVGLEEGCELGYGVIWRVEGRQFEGDIGCWGDGGGGCRIAEPEVRPDLCVCEAREVIPVSADACYEGSGGFEAGVRG